MGHINVKLNYFPFHKSWIIMINGDNFGTMYKVNDYFRLGVPYLPFESNRGHDNSENIRGRSIQLICLH